MDDFVIMEESKEGNKTMKVKVWNIDWDVSDEDYEESLGALEDDDGRPYTPKDLGLPAWDSEIILELEEPETDEDDDFHDDIDGALIVKYGFGAWDWNYEIVEP